MLKNINNDNGAALIMVLIMLVVVAGLAGGLLAATTFNTRFSGGELDRNQAFYAADAGVEYLKREINNPENSKENFDYLIDEKYIDDDNRIKFNLEQKTSSGNIITFESTGTVVGSPNISRSIKIDFIITKGADEPFQVQADYDPERDDREVLEGILTNPHTRELYDDGHIHITPQLLPKIDYWDDIVYKANEYNSNHDDEYTIRSPYNDSQISNGNYFNKFIFETIGDLQINPHNTFEKSVVVVDGDLQVNANNEFIDSVVIVKGNLHFSGSPQHQLTRSRFYIYGETEIEEDAELKTAGRVPDWDLDTPQISDEIVDIGRLSDETGDIDTSFWRQTR